MAWPAGLSSLPPQPPQQSPWDLMRSEIEQGERQSQAEYQAALDVYRAKMQEMIDAPPSTPNQIPTPQRINPLGAMAAVFSSTLADQLGARGAAQNVYGQLQQNEEDIKNTELMNWKAAQEANREDLMRRYQLMGQLHDKEFEVAMKMGDTAKAIAAAKAGTRMKELEQEGLMNRLTSRLEGNLETARMRAETSAKIQESKEKITRMIHGLGLDPLMSKLVLDWARSRFDEREKLAAEKAKMATDPLFRLMNPEQADSMMKNLEEGILSDDEILDYVMRVAAGRADTTGSAAPDTTGKAAPAPATATKALPEEIYKLKDQLKELTGKDYNMQLFLEQGYTAEQIRQAILLKIEEAKRGKR